MVETTKEAPIPVIESLAFGEDHLDTLHLDQSDLDDLAKDFENFQIETQDDDEVKEPSNPPVFWQYYKNQIIEHTPKKQVAYKKNTIWERMRERETY